MFLTIFGTVFLAELGDKTQLATLVFAANREVNLWLVFAGGSLEMLEQLTGAPLLGHRLFFFLGVLIAAVDVGEHKLARTVRTAVGVALVICIGFINAVLSLNLRYLYG